MAAASSPLVPLQAAARINHNNGSSGTIHSFFFLLPRAPITEASLKPQCRTRPNCGSSRDPQSRHHLPEAAPTTSSPNHAPLIAAEAYGGEQGSRSSPVERLRVKDSCPLQELRENDGDWSRDRFWANVKSLRHASRSREILRLLEAWKNVKPSWITATDYERIMELLCEEDLLDDAVSVLKEMETSGLRASLETYNSILHSFANLGRFEEVSSFLNEMKEQGFVPDTDTYRGLIRAYGKHKKFDEMGLCMKKMEANGHLPDYVIYNVLIREYSRGGLIHCMESVYRTLLSKRMYIQPSTLVSVLEVYTNLGILDKMERAYVRVSNSKVLLREDLIRKMTSVYIKNLMFSRLDDLGLNHPSTDIGDLSWCLRLLSHACLSSQRGIDSIVDKMEEERVPWSVTFINTILLAYLKMKDIKRLRVSLSQLPAGNVKPDMVTVGVLLDAKRIGFDATGTLHGWRRMRFLDHDAEMRTDPLVLSAFGKGRFLRSCEEVYSSLEPEARGRKRWTYANLIDLVSKV
ncbi:pentatricopeptide repeat-containing protein At4g14190, chloroplastic [Punica granatum]|uniref:Uncharacterized protein n=2 Tax=Punica granatum TaxID=22663 RepID=A0A2I0JXU5_PUNGR|nr:pentatricopeptide repeat-containing protein At4g14190, chloroplastic [Punica granatum]PKI61158.1 hypothetical protein CRG98_018478 [Punica granatum]